MSQAIALQSRYTPIDVGGAMRDGMALAAGDIKMQNMQKKSDLESMELDDAMGQQSALSNYRTKAGESDSVSALGELDAYPEMQTKIYETLDGMPVKERIKAKKKSEAYGRAARWVQSYPEGSPERQKAWETSLNVLKRDGYLDDEMYRMGMENGPSDMLLNEYITAEQFMKNYQISLKNDAQQPGSGGGKGMTSSQYLTTRRHIDNQVEGTERMRRAEIKQRKDNTPLTEDPAGPKGYLPEIENLSQGLLDLELKQKREALNKSYGIDGAAPDTPAPPSDVADASQAAGDGSSEASPAMPQSSEEFKALPKGAYFINPADGKLMRKR